MRQIPTMLWMLSLDVHPWCVVVVKKKNSCKLSLIKSACINFCDPWGIPDQSLFVNGTVLKVVPEVTFFGIIYEYKGSFLPIKANSKSICHLCQKASEIQTQRATLYDICAKESRPFLCVMPYIQVARVDIQQIELFLPAPLDFSCSWDSS